MNGYDPWRGSPSRTVVIALVQIGTTVALIGFLEMTVIGAAVAHLTVEDLLVPLLGWIYGAAGLLAWSRRPSSRVGPLLVAAGVSWLAAGLVGTEVKPLVALGLVSSTAPLALVVHVLHAFPSGRVRGAGRPIVLAGYVVALGMQAPLYLFASAPSPYDVLTLAARPNLVTITNWVQGIAGALVMIATAVVLVQRLQTLDSSRRRVMVPLIGYGIGAILMVPISAHVLQPWLGLSYDAVGDIQAVALAGVPVAFVVGLLRGGSPAPASWRSSGPGSAAGQAPDLH